MLFMHLMCMMYLSMPTDSLVSDAKLFSTLGDLNFIYCSVIASASYISLKGVKPMHLVSVVFNPHTILGSWSGHLSFVSSCSLFLTVMKIYLFSLSTVSLD